MKILNNVKKWLDGEDAISQTPEPQQQLSQWDEFFVKIAREVETVMKTEMFTPPGGQTYLPGEYIIFLSKEDDGMWQGRKREGLEEGLAISLSQRAKELVGGKSLKTDKIALSLSIDGALNKGQVRVQAVWDDNSPRTEVTARKPKPKQQLVAEAASEAVPEALADTAPGNTEPLYPEDGERTIIRPRPALFTVNFQRQGGEPEVFKSNKAKIEMGRGSKDFPVDVKLDGDQEISRKHAILTKQDAGFKLECVGRNAIEVDGREIQPGEHAEVKPGQTIKIGIYELTIAG
ncbi:MAG TPA: FHA domain-containing protein [Blastocatellia bacterium]|nr:FHA domain-containing protein [Blastocatellia bacterium]HMV84564.1 FHA domain-containing protein [Blastocatellia bacterium]HMX26826.1 FHA domain-containing protein [Blastocatellia bacterium]HMZ21872.1 FHA domain-containing protein [Blastocatellia bacterium]HNG32671.1 FHA domain-containing protein [Blastocatellia bacterium]